VCSVGRCRLGGDLEEHFAGLRSRLDFREKHVECRSALANEVCRLRLTYENAALGVGVCVPGVDAHAGEVGNILQLGQYEKLTITQ
jgi:hypothetical protein